MYEIPRFQSLIVEKFVLLNKMKLIEIVHITANEDLKRKMYGCILIVGGGMKFAGIATWLQNRISLQIPYVYRAGEFILAFRSFTIYLVVF